MGDTRSIQASEATRGRRKFGHIAVLFACAFPFTPPIIGRLDLQPFALIFAGIFMLSRLQTLKLRVGDSAWIVTGLAVTLMNLLLNPTAIEARLSASFLALVVFYLYGRELADDGLPSLARVVPLFLMVWLTICAMQIAGVNVEALSPDRTTPGRGVTGLAPEPTFAALHLICLLPAVAVIELMGYKGKTWLRIVAVSLLLTAILLHLSSTAIAAIVIGGTLAAFLASGTRARLLVGIIAVIISLLVVVFGYPDSEWAVTITQWAEGVIPGGGIRFTELLQRMFSAELLSDASFFDRAMSILKFIIDPYLIPLPRTHNGWIADVNAIIATMESQSLSYVNNEYRNLSGFGQLNYYLGILILMPVWQTLRLFVVMPGFVRFAIGIFLVSSFMSIPIASPFFGITYGLLSKSGSRCSPTTTTTT